MKLFVGLGNPGAKYAAHRHNIGFMAVDRIASDHGFSPWKRAFHGMVCDGRLGGERVMLLKPETFMNLSGQSVQAAAQFHKIAPGDITVFHDELDLPPGKIKVKSGGGHAGHNGLRSIHAHLGEGYGRVRLGIGHPGHKDRVADYVLHDFSKSEQVWLADVLAAVAQEATHLAAGDGPKFLNSLALRLAPAGQAQANSVASARAEPSPKPPVPAAGGAPEGQPDMRSPLERLRARFKP